MRRTIGFLMGMLAVPPGFADGESFQDWMESRSQQVENFREERDRAFHDFLSEQWEAFRVYRGEREDDSPKPRTIPEAPDAAPSGEPARRAGDRDATEPAPLTAEPSKAPAMPREQVAESMDEPGSDSRSESLVPQPSVDRAEFRFLGHDLWVSLPEAWDDVRVDGVNESGAAAFWADFASVNTDLVVNELTGIKDQLRLNGWGYLSLIRALSRSVHGEGNTAVALTWGLMLKSGYDIRLGFESGELVLLYRPEDKLFGVPYFHLDGARYYLLDHERGATPRVRTYRADYDGASRAVTVALRETPRAGGPEEQRELTLRYQGERHHFPVSINTALVAYLRTLPQQDVGAYFENRAQPTLEKKLVGPLQQATRRMERTKQVDFLLRFVQTAFEYKTDQEQFGREDYLYPEETLYYPASDCEDRSVLFAWLARRVLDLEAAALDYPGHVSTAVNLDGGDGARVRIDGRTLMVADPTYINARVGMVMPKYQDQQPEVIPLW